jgi:hypothetical protein
MADEQLMRMPKPFRKLEPSPRADLLGFFQAFTPRFVKKCENLPNVIAKAFHEYIEETWAKSFPAEEHTYKILEGELEKLQNHILLT